MAIINQMQSYGEKITDQTIIKKVLRSLTPKFDHVVAAIEEYKDLSVFSFDELMGSLLAHESRINMSLEKQIEEKAFQVKETVSKFGEIKISTTRGCGRGRGRGRGRCRFDGQPKYTSEQRNNKNGVQCYQCKGYGHVKAYCPKQGQQVNYAAENKEEKLDETQKVKVHLGNGKDVQVKEKGTVSIETNHGKVRLLHNVQFVPDLGYNLLSVGQLMACGYSISFDNGACVIKKKNSENTLITVNMAPNKMFPLEVSCMENLVLAAS
ncbi:uncharacterized protein [Henckelia pumila]|uniref:uncharacterized protein n=1 Tax=Henckelia pumila TaxID=405737 RepID=UPI003C6E7C1C